jgi:hypothetical protein
MGEATPTAWWARSFAGPAPTGQVTKTKDGESGIFSARVLQYGWSSAAL